MGSHENLCYGYGLRSRFCQSKKEAENFKEYQGKLKENGDTLLEAIKEMFAIQRRLENVYVYASMKNDQDTANAENQAKNATVQKLVAEVSKNFPGFNRSYCI